RETRQVKPHMSRADDVQLRRRLDRLDVDVHLPAADQPGFLREVVGELVMYELRLTAADRDTRLAERVVFIAAAANGADGAAVGKYEHLGAHALRRRAARRHDGDERRRLAPFERIGERGKDLLVHRFELYGRP